MRGIAYLEESGVDGRIILKLIFKETVWGSVDWIDLSQERDE
jgi:hypothetical protein